MAKLSIFHISLCLIFIHFTCGIVQIYTPETINGEKCQIPFEYRGKVHHDCISHGSFRRWCFLDKDFKKWNYCRPHPVEFKKCILRPPNVTVEEVKEILQEHNNFRSQMAALRMRKLTWNSELAQLAQSSAEKCQHIHRDFHLCGNRQSIGQNLYYNYLDAEYPNLMPWRFVINQWTVEQENYNMENMKCRDNKICGHFLQASWDSSSLIGCGKAFCFGPLMGQNRYSIQYYCNYYEIGNIPGRRPFKETDGSKCQDCHLFDKKKTFRCDDQDLCEACEDNHKDCTGTKSIALAVLNGYACADTDSHCSMNKYICNIVRHGTKITRLLNYVNKCQKTCGICS